jgi:hypothetical protein
MQFFGSFFIRAGEADETRLRYWELSWYGGSAPQVSLTVLRDFSPVQTNPDGAFSCRSAQWAISTGTVIDWRMVRVVLPSTISRSREWP